MFCKTTNKRKTYFNVYVITLFLEFTTEKSQRFKNYQNCKAHAENAQHFRDTKDKPIEIQTESFSFETI